MSLFDNPTTNEPHKVISGEHRTYEFDNGFSASVIRGELAIPDTGFRGAGSHGAEQGLWELAVMDDDGLRYDTPITPHQDVVGYLTEADVEKLLVRIKALEWIKRTNVGPGGP